MPHIAAMSKEGWVTPFSSNKQDQKHRTTHNTNGTKKGNGISDKGKN
jgi:hypothetical protein